MSTEQRFFSSTLAAYGSQSARMVVRFIADFCLMRLVLPEQHGLFELAFPFVILAGFVRDMGLPYQAVRDERRPFGAVFAWEVYSGVVVTLVVVAASPLTAILDPGLPQVVRWLSLFILLDGLAAVARTYFETDLSVGRIVAPEVARSLTFAVVAIGLGYLGYGVWSLVAGELTAIAVLTAALWWRARHFIDFDFQPELIRDMLSRSYYLFVIALTANALPFVGPYVIKRIDSTTATVAHYSKALMWSFRLQSVVVPAIVRVLYPTLVRYRDDFRRFATAFRVCTVSVLAIEAITTYFLFINAEVFMTELFGEEWSPAVPFLRVLCFAPLIEPFSRLGGEVLKARNEDRLWFISTAVNLISLIVFGLILTGWLGAIGMAWANFLLLGHLLIGWRLYKLLDQDFLKLCAELLLVYLLPLPYFAVATLLTTADSWERLLACIAASAMAFATAVYYLQGPVKSLFRTDGESTPDAA